MLAKGMDETTIMEMTGLSQEQIYEIALSRVHFTLKIALYSVQFANICKDVAIKYLDN